MFARLGVLGDPTFPAGGPLAVTVTMGDIAGRFTSDVTARLPSAALWSACSLTVTVTFSTCGGSTGALLALKNPFIVVLFDETFDLTRRLRFRNYGDLAARLVPFQPMAHGFTL